MKTCIKCNQTLSLDQYYGRHTSCKSCDSKEATKRKRAKRINQGWIDTAIIIDDHKFCRCCKKSLHITQYRKYKSGTLLGTCKHCLYEKEKLLTNIDDRRLKSRTYYWNNKNDIKIRRSTDEYKLQQKERANKCYLKYKTTGIKKIWEDKNRQELSDSYVKYVLVKGTDLSAKDIPQSLIELKREQLILTRKLRNHE